MLVTYPYSEMIEIISGLLFLILGLSFGTWFTVSALLPYKYDKEIFVQPINVYGVEVIVVKSDKIHIINANNLGRSWNTDYVKVKIHQSGYYIGIWWPESIEYNLQSWKVEVDPWAKQGNFALAIL